MSEAHRVDGVLTVSMAVAPWMELPGGQQTVGALGVLIDDAIGTDVWWDRPDGTHSVTSRLSVDVPIPPP